MVILNWQPQFEVKVEELDEQHKEIVKLINLLHDSVVKNSSKEVLEEIIQRLESYTMDHLALEEDLMKKLAYPQFHIHQESHNKLRKKFNEIKELFYKDLPITMSLSKVLDQWLTKHIMGEDKAFGSFYNNQTAKSENFESAM